LNRRFFCRRTIAASQVLADFLLQFNLISNGMKKDQKDKTDINKPQTGQDIKKHLPVKNAMTDTINNTATQTVGLNQERTTRDDLFPSDGDNMTR